MADDLVETSGKDPVETPLGKKRLGKKSEVIAKRFVAVRQSYRHPLTKVWFQMGQPTPHDEDGWLISQVQAGIFEEL